MDGAGDGWLVLPERPGPLQPWAPGRRRDDVDDLVDELLGPSPEGGPGAADVVLVTGGAGLIIAQQAAGLPPGVAVAGGIALLLGLVLPARSVVRGQRDAATRRRVEALLGAGRLLDARSGPVHDLVTEYSVVVAADPHLPHVREAVATAHLAVQEVAVLLHGRSPATPVEVAYVAERTAALSALARALAVSAAGADARSGFVSAALAELEQGTGSVSRLHDLAAELRDGAP